jgi:hypothetical protein
MMMSLRISPYVHHYPYVHQGARGSRSPVAGPFRVHFDNDEHTDYPYMMNIRIIRDE